MRFWIVKKNGGNRYRIIRKEFWEEKKIKNRALTVEHVGNLNSGARSQQLEENKKDD